LLDDGRRIVAVTPLSENELTAYREYPDTFFGVIDASVGRQCKSIIESYDFFFETYGNTPKEKLLEFLKTAPDLEALALLSQRKLAETYCERLAYKVIRNAAPGQSKQT
jgi:hypothetical protein